VPCSISGSRAQFVGLIVACAAGATQLAGQAGVGGTTGNVRGVVRHSASNAPLASVQVSIQGTRLGTMTREDGTFLIQRVPAGSHRVQVRLIGYAPTDKALTVRAGDTATVDFALVPAR
jgi:hypothetical protein